jgi:hypothetical protein
MDMLERIWYNGTRLVLGYVKKTATSIMLFEAESPPVTIP